MPNKTALSKRRYLGAGAVAVLAVMMAPSAYTAAVKDPTPIPNFAPDDHTSWYPDRQDGDNFLPPEGGGPGPILSPPDKPYVPNAGFVTSDPALEKNRVKQSGAGDDFASTHPTYRIPDLTNPILQPWVREKMKVDSDEVEAGKIPFMARERCYPGGVPEFLVFRRVAPPMVFFIQTPKEVLITWRTDQQYRHVYLNVGHSKNVKPSWYGESVGHYEGSDTLVVDTIGLNTKTYVDNYRTPHTDQLHVVERFHILDGGKYIHVNAYVEDPGAFTMPWNALQRFGRWTKDPFDERTCAESASLEQFASGNYGATHTAGVIPVPHADKPDF